MKRMKNTFLLSFLFGLFSGIFSVVGVSFAQTVPDELVYEGQLFDSTNTPITTEHVIRISLWRSNDFLPGDVDGVGAINAGSANYGGWTEVQNFTPAFNGSFSIQLGVVNPMPLVYFFDQKFFQIEIKALGDPDTSYELLDPTGDDGADTEDRQKIGSVLYAKNAQRLENKSIGTSDGDIPILGTGGKFTVAQIPGGTNEDTFIIDADDNAGGNIFLQFGNLLNKSLFWNAISSWFEFSDSLKVDGDLIVTGTITQPDQDHTELFTPRYKNAIFEADGTQNVGSMREHKEAVSGEKKNFLTWVSRESILQDYGIQIRYKIPENFKGFQTNAISFGYKTSGTVSDSKIDIQVEKEGTLGNQIVGASGDNLSNTTYSVQNFSLLPSTTWNPGDVLLILIKPYSRNNNEVFMGDVEIKTIY